MALLNRYWIQVKYVGIDIDRDFIFELPCGCLIALGLPDGKRPVECWHSSCEDHEEKDA